MKTIFAVLALALFPALSFADASIQPIPDAFSASLEPLARVVSSGSEKACAPIYLTISGPERKSSRLYFSAPIAKLAATARESSRRGPKLTRVQSRALDHLIRLALAAQKNGGGFDGDTIRATLAGTGLNADAQMLCLSSERISASPEKTASPSH